MYAFVPKEPDGEKKPAHERALVVVGRERVRLYTPDRPIVMVPRVLLTAELPRVVWTDCIILDHETMLIVVAVAVADAVVRAYLARHASGAPA